MFELGPVDRDRPCACVLRLVPESCFEPVIEARLLRVEGTLACGARGARQAWPDTPRLCWRTRSADPAGRRACNRLLGTRASGPSTRGGVDLGRQDYGPLVLLAVVPVLPLKGIWRSSPIQPLADGLANRVKRYGPGCQSSGPVSVHLQEQLYLVLLRFPASRGASPLLCGSRFSIRNGFGVSRLGVSCCTVCLSSA